MKLGYKVFLISSLISIALDCAKIKIPSTIEDIWGIIILIGLIHAWFIEKTPPKPYKPSTFTYDDSWFRQQEEWYWHEKRRKKNK